MQKILFCSSIAGLLLVSSVFAAQADGQAADTAMIAEADNQWREKSQALHKITIAVLTKKEPKRIKS